MKSLLSGFLENKRSKKFLLPAIFAFFLIVYALTDLVNHYMFRSSALDLGMFNQALYCFAHFKANYFTLDMKGAEVNYFGDHFSPIMFLYVPFYYLFGSYALLVVQLIAVLFGGWGVYKYASLKIEEERTCLFIVIHFFSIWGIFAAMGFDFHNNVIGAMFVPWLVYYNDLKNRKLFLLFFFLILFTKENMSLWLVFIVLGLILKDGLKDKRMLGFQLAILVFAAVYFLVIVGYVMPAIRQGEGLSQLDRYAHLGNSIPEIIHSLLTKPRYVISLLVENTLPDTRYDGIKAETYFMILVSGGLLLFFRPFYLVMLIPVIAQKMLANNVDFWGIMLQYSIEFAPVLSLCLIDVASKRRHKQAFILVVSVTLSTVFFTFQKIEKEVGHGNYNLAFYRKGHYSSHLDLPEIRRVLETIDDEATVSCNTKIAPHLARREKLYYFPIVKNADYIVLITDGFVFPCTPEEYVKARDFYKNSGHYTIEYENNELLMLRRKGYLDQNRSDLVK